MGATAEPSKDPQCLIPFIPFVDRDLLLCQFKQTKVQKIAFTDDDKLKHYMMIILNLFKEKLAMDIIESSKEINGGNIGPTPFNAFLVHFFQEQCGD